MSPNEKGTTMKISSIANKVIIKPLAMVQWSMSLAATAGINAVAHQLTSNETILTMTQMTEDIAALGLFAASKIGEDY